jgi:hypothetical protein
VLGMASWLDVELCSFFGIAIFSSDGMEVIHGPVEGLLIDLTANRERTIGVIVAYYDRGLPIHDAIAS